jgi:hypothetical protein
MSKGRNNEVIKKKCTSCQEDKRLTDFYMSGSPLHADKKIPVCKSCLSAMFDEHNIENSLKNILRQIDKPYIYDLLETSIEENPNNIFGTYMKNISMPQYKGLTWNNSTLEPSNKGDIEEKYNIKTEDFKVTSDLILKWGDYSPEEIKAFERKYQMLKNNYQEKTAMHTEALLIYIRYRVKEEMATQKGDVREAKEWGALAQKAAQDAKINPSQLSKSDLSDGLDSFSQLVRSVEQAVDIIEILPKFKERPQDSVDMTIWCYINYIRDLKGLPLAEYKDIYAFVEERKKEYENMIGNEENDEL